MTSERPPQADLRASNFRDPFGTLVKFETSQQTLVSSPLSNVPRFTSFQNFVLRFPLFGSRLKMTTGAVEDNLAALDWPGAQDCCKV